MIFLLQVNKLKKNRIFSVLSGHKTPVSYLENFNGHGRPFVVGCGAQTTLEYVETLGLGNFIDKWQAPAGESEQHSANKSFQNRHTRKRKLEKVQSADGLPGKRPSRRKQTSPKKIIHDCTVTKLENIKDRDTDLWKYFLISYIILRLYNVDPY